VRENTLKNSPPSHDTPNYLHGEGSQYKDNRFSNIVAETKNMMHTSYGMRKESEAANFETGKPNSHGHGQFGNIVDEKHER
jgi:hypothetical protein